MLNQICRIKGLFRVESYPRAPKGKLFGNDTLTFDQNFSYEEDSIINNDSFLWWIVPFGNNSSLSWSFPMKLTTFDLYPLKTIILFEWLFNFIIPTRLSSWSSVKFGSLTVWLYWLHSELNSDSVSWFVLIISGDFVKFKNGLDYASNEMVSIRLLNSVPEFRSQRARFQWWCQQQQNRQCMAEQEMNDQVQAIYLNIVHLSIPKSRREHQMR